MEEERQLPAQTASKKSIEHPGLSNLEKLYHVPVFALRELLESRVPGQKLGHLCQAELVANADEMEVLTAADVEDLYDSYRYGQRLTFYLYLLPEDLAEPDIKEFQSALDELCVPGRPELSAKKVANGGYETETSPDQIDLLDEERLNGIREIRYRYYVVHRFLNTSGEPDKVLQTRYGFLWLDLDLGYLTMLSNDERVNSLLTRALSSCLKAIPLAVRFPKELVDKFLSIEKVKHISHYDPSTGVRQSISGESLWKTSEQEILAREERYARPSSLYEEEVADGVTSGLGVTLSKGKIYFTKTLPVSLVRGWGLQRLPDLVRGLKDLRASQPGSYNRSIEAINRIRLPLAGKAAIASIVEALLQADREDLTSVRLGQTARAIYDALAGKYFRPYLRTECSHCEESAELCPHCESLALDMGAQHVTCKQCGATISDGESVVLRCMNGHTTSVPLAEAFSIAPNHWLQKRMVRILAEIGQLWNMQSDYFHIEGIVLHRLRRAQVEGNEFPQLVQAYINNFWEPVNGQVHAGSGDILVNHPVSGSDLQSTADAQQPEGRGSGAVPQTYRSFDLRLRGDAVAGYTVEADVAEGGSVPPQSLVLPPGRTFQYQLARVMNQTTTDGVVRSVGEALFNALFSSRIAKLWANATGGLEDGMGLRIRLRIDPPELMALPWELIYDEDYVALHLRFPVVRYLDLPGPPRPLTVRPPLRVLVAVSQPKDARQLDVDAGLDRIREALTHPRDRVEMDVLEHATRDELLTRLRQGYHVLHYLGHGLFKNGEGYLILEDSEGRSDPASASLLGQMVMGSNLRLAVLNACETAVTGLESPLGGLAHQMARAGMPAVIAMQMTIAEQTASAFSREFYGALADGWPVDAAVQQGRRSIVAVLGNEWNECVDWAIPTLYMRAPDGIILGS